MVRVSQCKPMGAWIALSCNNIPAGLRATPSEAVAERRRANTRSRAFSSNAPSCLIPIPVCVVGTRFCLHALDCQTLQQALHAGGQVASRFLGITSVSFAKKHAEGLPVLEVVCRLLCIRTTAHRRLHPSVTCNLLQLFDESRCHLKVFEPDVR